VTLTVRGRLASSLHVLFCSGNVSILSSSIFAGNENLNSVSVRADQARFMTSARLNVHVTSRVVLTVHRHLKISFICILFQMLSESVLYIT
jgi:hypothetical protein